MKREAVIVSAVRTPVGRCRGALAAVGAPELGALVIAEAVRRAGLKGEEVEEVIFGNLGNNDSANLARVVTLQAGLPFTVPAITIDRQCSSGLNAIAMGALMIEAGEADILVAGGTESDSNRPHLMEKARVAYQVAPPQWLVRRTAPGRSMSVWVLPPKIWAESTTSPGRSAMPSPWRATERRPPRRRQAGLTRR